MFEAFTVLCLIGLIIFQEIRYRRDIKKWEENQELSRGKFPTYRFSKDTNAPELKFEENEIAKPETESEPLREDFAIPLRKGYKIEHEISGEAPTTPVEGAAIG